MAGIPNPPWNSPERWGPPPATPGPWGTQWSGAYLTAERFAAPPAPQGATNALAVAAMVLGILWIWWLGSILALVFGYVALKQIRASNQPGRGMAVAGIVLGWVGVALGTVILVGAAVTAGHVGSAPATGSTSIHADRPLSSQILPAPVGFSLSQRVEADNGTMTGADFDQFVSNPDAAASLQFVTGYELTYDSNQTSDSIQITLLQFATAADASRFQGGFSVGGPTTSKADPAIPGADDFDSTAADAGTYVHGVIATRDTEAFLIYFFDGSAPHVPLVERLARHQYASL